MVEAAQYKDGIAYTNVTIANGQTTSGAIDMYGTTLCGYYMPASWTAADVTYKASSDNSTFSDVYSSAGSKRTSVVAGNRFIALDPAEFAGIRYLKLVSTNSQGADRTITLVSRPV